MARPIILSNGELHVGINKLGLVHDFYFPYVGLENHAAGKDLRHKVGVYVDGQISWLDDGAWECKFSLSSKALVGHIRAKNEALGIVLEFEDFVYSDGNIFIREIHIINARNYTRDIRLFLHQAFVIGDSRSNTDTAQYLPDSDAILHYRGRRAFVIGGETIDNRSFDQRSIGLFGIEGREGTWRDAEDGELSNGSVEHGRVDSTIRFSLSVEAHGSSRVIYWITAGTSTRTAISLHKTIRDNSPASFKQATVAWWQEWLAPVQKVVPKLPKHHHDEFLKSAMVIKSHTDRRGAIIASTDTSMLNYSRDAYGYCWPRDGAYVMWPLIRLGYTNEPLAFFDFCKNALHPHGYLMHKYRADGALGSSWHPYVHDSLNAPPIQEDETALTVFVFAQFYRMNPSKLLLQQYYEPFIKKMAQFMASYLDETTGLPKPTYDLWEEVFQTSTYTTALVHAALLEAADLAEIYEDADSAVHWRSVADDIKQAAQQHLYSPERQALRKGVSVVDGEISYDDTIDVSSFFGAFMYGLFPPESDTLTNTMTAIKNAFLVSESSVGIPRYENDSYQRRPGVAPNWWFITSMWLAQYYNELGDHEHTQRILDWVVSLASSTGMFSEQIHPETHEPLSVSPLVWSHAEYMATLLDTISESKP